VRAALSHIAFALISPNLWSSGGRCDAR
jgi:hypothetical protein